MRKYISKWNLSRVLRLGLGILILFQGIESREWFFIAIGLIFSLLAVLNYGFCGSTACDITQGYTDDKTKNNGKL